MSSSEDTKQMQKSNKTRHDDYSLWSLRTKTVLKEEGLWTELWKKVCGEDTKNESLPMLAAALNEKVLLIYSQKSDNYHKCWKRLKIVSRLVVQLQKYLY